MTTKSDIRYLIENYYDIQKLRVETFNRIVSYVKENKDKIIEMIKNLSQASFETHLAHASHFDIETQLYDASQSVPEPHKQGASQTISETHLYDASQKSIETQLGNASQNFIELQRDDASQKSFETHFVHASHRGIETHGEGAISLLENKKYAEFVEKYVVNGKIELEEIENLLWFYKKLYETEKGLYKILDAWSKEHPLRTNFLNYVKGIGPVLSSGIIAWLGDAILKAEHVSNIWSYCGLTPNSERRRGEKLNYNPKLKTFCWKIGQSFIKFKCFGRKLYDTFKEETQRKHPDWSKLHIHNYARRKVVKLFIASVWEVWRKMNNLPTTEPYPIQILGHSKTKITPDMWIEGKKSTNGD